MIRFDEETQKVELDYPRDMSIWRGVGYNIDAAFRYKDGKFWLKFFFFIKFSIISFTFLPGQTYFFKDKGFWKFNDHNMRVYHEKRKPSAQHWMGCKRGSNDYEFDARREPLVVDPNCTSSSNFIYYSSHTPFAILMCLLLFIKLKF